MRTPGECLEHWNKQLKKEWKLSFASAFLIGLLVHLPIMLSDIPNHDGLASMYFDQNMITSGRWFLTVACGISSYFTLPWLIGLLALLYLALTAAVLTELLELRDSVSIVLISGLLVAFPAATSTFAYVFTMDGYMMGLFFAVLSVLLVKKGRFGFLAGGVCLALSMGIYQAYLAFAVLLCIYCIAVRMTEEGSRKLKIRESLRYLLMGILGAGIYYGMLHLLLAIQGKELASYQGISGLDKTGAARSGLAERLAGMYLDFGAFTLRGNVLFNNGYSGIAFVLLAGCALLVLLWTATVRKWWKNPWFFVIIAVVVLGVPLAANVILLVSPDVTYHLLMRWQWVLFPIIAVAFCQRFLSGTETEKSPAFGGAVSWICGAAAFVLLFNYAVTDNIAYSNLEKRYEKTYAYCVRLLDRIEQTEGYYQGIPVAMVGVVGTEQFPVTDITGQITGGMLGIGGDSLLYTSGNYAAFMEHYLGASLNFLDVDTMGEIYYSEEYIAMDSFPGENSVQLVDGVIYIKTENVNRD